MQGEQWEQKISMHYVGNLYAKSSKATDIYGERMSYHIFIEGAETSICYTLGQQWAM